MKDRLKDQKTKQQKKAAAKNTAVPPKGRGAGAPTPTIAELIARQDPAMKERGVTIPVNQLVLEATRCYDHGSKLRERLRKVPTFDVAYLDRLPPLAEGLAEQETIWHIANTTKRARSIAPVRSEAETMRSDIVGDARYLFRKDDVALAKLDEVGHGSSTSDLVADLRKLSSFLETYAEVFFADGSRPPDLAQQASATAAKLLHGNDSTSAADAQARRNQLYHLLQEHLDEVRAAARYLLRDDPKQLAPMLSHYNALRQKSLRKHKKGSNSDKGKQGSDTGASPSGAEKTGSSKG